MKYAGLRNVEGHCAPFSMIVMYNIDDFDFAELKMFIFGEKTLDVEQN